MRSRTWILLVSMLAVAALAFPQEEAPEMEEEAPDLSYELLDAVREGTVRDVNRLLGEGADPNALTDAGMPAIAMAAFRGHREVVAALIEAGADLGAQDHPGATALMYAAWQGHVDIVNDLIAAGADVDATDNTGWTPLIHAAVGGSAEAARALLDAGANKDATDAFDRSALQVAESRGHDEFVAALEGNVEAEAEPSSGS